MVQKQFAGMKGKLLFTHLSIYIQVYFIISSNGCPGAELHDKITLHNIVLKNQNVFILSKISKYLNI